LRECVNEEIAKLLNIMRSPLQRFVALLENRRYQMADYGNMSISEVQRLAKQGDKDALYEMQYRYPDNAEVPGAVWAAFWLEKAAEKGHIFAKRKYAGMLIDIPVSDSYKENRQKAMQLFENIAADFDANRLAADERSIGMVAKIELGIMLCEGFGTLRDCKKGLELIKNGESSMQSLGGLRFNHLYRLGEMYSLGYAQEGEEPSISDLKKAINYLEAAVKNFDSQNDPPQMLDFSKQLLDIQKKRIVGKEELKKALGKEETYDSSAQERRKERMQPTEIGRQVDSFRQHLRECLAREGW